MSNKDYLFNSLAATIICGLFFSATYGYFRYLFPSLDLALAGPSIAEL